VRPSIQQLATPFTAVEGPVSEAEDRLLRGRVSAHRRWECLLQSLAECRFHRTEHHLRRVVVDIWMRTSPVRCAKKSVA